MQALSNEQTLAIVFAVAAGTMLTRFLPFWLFPEKKQAPRLVLFLGQALPPAMMGLLLVYCLKNVSLAAAPHAIPEAAALACIYFLHRRWKNALLSIGGGTAIYLALLRLLAF